MNRGGLILAVCAAVLAACDQAPETQVYQGYIEGEYVLIAPEEGGRIAEVYVERGQVVASGALLFAMERTDMAAERAEAAARLAQAEAELGDLLMSRMRPEEIAVIEADVMEAEATVREAEVEFTRQQELAKKDFASRAALDTALASRDRARARLVSLRNELAVARLPGRDDQIGAAEQHVEAARAALAHADWRLGQRVPVAPQSGVIEDVVRHAGETASPTMPVISLLPPENRKVRFFIPETERSWLQLGALVAVVCDGCAPGLTAEIAFIANEAEYTPPVIFSVESRDKLVYMVEAVPLNGAAHLTPGQPVDIRLDQP